jgi:hypothetical protein
MESENYGTEEILEESQEGPQEGGQTPFLPGGNIDGANTYLYRKANDAQALRLSFAAIWAAVRNFNNVINSKMLGENEAVTFLDTDSGNNVSLPNRPLFLKDLLDLLDPTSDISKVFNAIPIAQYKHLPDPSVLNTNPVNGGQYNLPTNQLNEESLETNEVTPEVMPSLEVEEPVTSGGARSHKWSSHKKRRHTRIRTKKNKKL